VNKVAAAFMIALVAALLTIVATGGRSQAQETNIITVGPADVGFGAVQVDLDPTTFAERTVTVTNTGSTAITLDLLLLNQNAGFSFTLPGGGNQLVLNPFNEEGDKVELTVKFDPVLALGETEVFRETQLVFDSGLGGPTLATVDLSGTGTSYDPTDPDENPNPGVQSDCTIIGTDNSDQLTGTAANDVICALGGNDRIDGQGGDDELRGENGRDKITDKSGKDKLIGGAKKDRLNARDGSKGDVLMGGPGKDKIVKDKKDKGRR
jgi:Ca2+-binding RTX toxin-like protein